MNRISEDSESWRHAEGNLSRLSGGALKGSELKTCTRCLMTLRSERAQIFAARKYKICSADEASSAIDMNKKAGQAIKVYAMMVGLMGPEGSQAEWQHAQELMSKAAAAFSAITSRYKQN